LGIEGAGGMKLKLDPTPKRSLEIEMPDGKMVNLVLKKIRMKDYPEFAAATNKHDSDYKKGKINAWEYHINLLTLSAEVFKPSDFEDLEPAHFELIWSKIIELMKNKEVAEKKSLE
jgi:hypothetical protein